MDHKRIKRIKQIEKEISEIRNRLPAHSTSNLMMLRLIELEDELSILKKDKSD